MGVLKQNVMSVSTLPEQEMLATVRINSGKTQPNKITAIVLYNTYLIFYKISNYKYKIF